VEGLKTKGPLNINHATKEQLETLPGIDGAAADRIIAGRPYKNSEELTSRHIISRAEYHQIATKIETR
ncbi:MAG: helix-hairpin-helix domain-containing protein, partial [Acidobacteriaceae bacterium]